MSMVMVGPMELLMLFLLGGGGFGLPLGVPPGPEDPVLAQAAPQECLFYASWAGTATPDPNSSNQTEQLLAEPEVQHLIGEAERLLRTALGKAARDEGPEAAAMAEDAVRWVKVLLTHPTAMFLSKMQVGPGGPDVEAGAAVNVGDEIAELRTTLERYQEKFLGGAAQSVRIGDDTWYRITLDPKAPPITWGTKGPYFVVGVGAGAVEGMLDRAETAPPEWLVRIGEQLPVERRATVAYLNLKTIRQRLVGMAPGPMVGTVVEALGLGNLDSVASVTGLDGTGFVTKTLIGLDGEPQGLLALASTEPLSPGDLAPIPCDSTVALAFRLNAENVLDTILSIAGKIEPHAREEIERGLGEMQEHLGFDLRRDLLQALGDTWCVYNSPSEGGLVFTGLTGVVRVKDRSRLAAAHAKLLAGLRREFGDRRHSPRIDEFSFAGQTVYVFNARDDDVPVAPSWCLTDDEFVIAPFPQNVKAYLSHGDDHRSIAELDAVAQQFEQGRAPVKLWYADTRAMFELFYPFVPMFAQMALGELAREEIDVSVSILPSARAIVPHLRPTVGVVRRTEAGIEITCRQSLPGGNVGASLPISVALLLPAVQAAREAARRAQSTNNMKQIALALHNYHDAYKTFPPAYTTDENGKPLLSWRVQILPFVEASPLYERFHLDEPWDSEHNRELIPMMPPVYRSPNSTAGPGMTNYLGVGGEGGIFAGKEGTRIAEIRDGTSNTIMVVEANNQSAVIWTRPADFQPDPQDPIRGLVGIRPGGFLAGFADGSVRFISESIDRRALRLLFDRDDGQPVRDF